MRKVALISAIFLAGCAADLQPKINYATDLWCPEMGMPKGHTKYPDCYNAVSETFINFPNIDADRAIIQAREVCHGVAEDHELCIVKALNTITQAQRAEANMSAEQYRRIGEALKNMGNSMQAADGGQGNISCTQAGPFTNCHTY